MGLDMYLSKRTYVGAEFKHRHVKMQLALTIEERPIFIKPERVSYIEERVAYWRKANAIHGWFVDKCQDGVDECQETEVSREQLDTLLRLCIETLETRDASKLPPTPGFFFGSTEVDDWYWYDLRDTIKMLREVLAEPEGRPYETQFFYRSSW